MEPVHLTAATGLNRMWCKGKQQGAKCWVQRADEDDVAPLRYGCFTVGLVGGEVGVISVILAFVLA
jgi:hypothetical protein